MEHNELDDMDIEALPSMWPEDVGPDVSKQFNVEKPRADQDMLEEVTIAAEQPIVDFKRLLELTNHTETGSSQLAYLVKHWEYRQANVTRLLREELDILSKQREESELKKLEILEEHRFEEDRYGCDKRPVSILENVDHMYDRLPRRKTDVVVKSRKVEIDAEYDTVMYWKQRALHLQKSLEASVQREQALVEKLQESVQNLEQQSSPVEELSQILKRADNFLHFVLQNAPVVIGHQDKELRYRFIYNHFPSLHEDDIIGKTDVEIFTGAGVKESQDFKQEVLEKGLPSKREITFETPLFGSKTFLIYVEPVFSKAGETIGINYMGMDITDQVRKREKMLKVREEIAVQKAKETELNKTIHITEETMRAKQMLATMSHEIRSPLSGVVSMADILSRTNLDREQRQLIKVMISSGDLVLQLINDILDLSKVESGVMKLEATKFRPREVVRHVLQTAAASLQKILTLEGYVADDVPIEVIGDVLRIRQILTNLISNAIKFTHEGKVGIKLYVVPEPQFAKEESYQKQTTDQSIPSIPKGNHSSTTESCIDKNCLDGEKQNESSSDHPSCDSTMDPEKDDQNIEPETTTVWIRCDVYDTGIGIPENGLPSLFKKYMQVSADHARKYGGTGLGLAICKQLVELMGGRLTVTSKVKCGSTFTFILPYKVSSTCDSSDDPDELSDMVDHDVLEDDLTAGFFQFHPRTLGSLFSSNGSMRATNLLPQGMNYNTISNKPNGFHEDSYSVPDNSRLKETISPEETSCSTILSDHESSFSHSPGTDDENAGYNKICPGGGDKPCGNHSTDSVSHSGEIREAEIMAKKTEPTGSRRNREQSETSLKSTDSPEEPKPKPKILLVEDNKMIVMVTQSMMKQLGHAVDVVNNGVEAVRAVQRHNYDLILMDVCMPVMDGLEATRLIRSFEETGSWDAAVQAGVEPSVLSSNSSRDASGSTYPTSRIPVIAMTANALSESADECYANGMDSFVSKPVTFQKLKDCLENYLPLIP
ncbi:hypothetical protein ACFE04_016649 [Oxalis oulophora]